MKPWNGINQRFRAARRVIPGNGSMPSRRQANYGRRVTDVPVFNVQSPNPGSVGVLLKQYVWDEPPKPVESFRQMCLKLFPHAEALYCGVSQSWLVFTENRPGHGRAYWNNAGRGNTESEAWKSLYNSRRV